MTDLVYTSNDKFVNCFYSLMPIVEQYYGKNLSIIYSHSWDFILTKNDNETIGKRIKPFSWNNIVSPFMGGLTGLTIKKDDSLAFSDLKDIINLEIDKNNPIIITVDAICCPWTRLFGKLEYLHHILVTGYQQDTHQYVGYDALSNKKILFDLSIFCSYFYGAYYFQQVDIDLQINSIVIMQDVLKKKDRMIKDLLYFKDLIPILDVENEKQGIFQVENIPLVLRLDEICQLRKNYVKFIEIFEKKGLEKQCLEIKNSFLNLSKEWEKCKLHFVKLFLSRKEKIKDHIIETMESIVVKEEKSIALIEKVFIF